MSKKEKAKFYVVWEGNNTGIFTSWADCLQQVKGYPNAKYKSYLTKQEAEDAYYLGTPKQSLHRTSSSSEFEDWKPYVPQGSIAVDAACSGNPGDMEYQGVDPYTKEVIFLVGPLKMGTNNIGEFLAIVHALALLKKRNNSKASIFTDSKTALSWIKRKKANTKLEFVPANQPIKELLQRATLWLNQNTFLNPIVKWETERWGEIPADFGRK